MPPIQIKCDHLALGMHTRIRTPGCQDRLPLPADLVQGIFYSALHAASLGLPLKALVVRAVVS